MFAPLILEVARQATEVAAVTPDVVAQAIALALAASFIYLLIGVIPGTDETATMAPLTLALVLMGLDPRVLLAWFMAACAAFKLAHTIPTAVAALPGGVMAVPMVPYCAEMKKLGLAHVAMRKMAAGSFIGTFIGFFIALALAYPLATYGIAEVIKPYVKWFFLAGAIVIGLLAKARWACLAALVPFSLLIAGCQHISKMMWGRPIVISVFMGITVGPMIFELFSLLVPTLRQQLTREGPSRIYLAPEVPYKLFPNPFKVLKRKQIALASSLSAVTSPLFFLSPAGMTIMFGEIVAGSFRKLESPKDIAFKDATTIATMDAITSATYVAQTIIPLMAFGIPLSPMAMGPALPLFYAPPRFTCPPFSKELHNLHTLLTPVDYLIFGLIGIVIGLLVPNYPIAMRYARRITELVLKYISHEALLALFIAIVATIGYYEAGITGLCLTMLIALVGGFLHKLGVHVGFQFMCFYSVSAILTLLKWAAGAGF
mgnify:CR=1 FL=1